MIKFDEIAIEYAALVIVAAQQAKIPEGEYFQIGFNAALKSMTDRGWTFEAYPPPQSTATNEVLKNG